jgi:hypothetical protein
VSEATEATNPEGEDLEEVAEGAAAQGDDQDTELDQDSDEEQPPEETEEIEHDGKKYSIPKALKPALLMQADYTRKTQEVAATKQELEQRAQAIAQQAEAQSALLQDHVAVASIKAQVDAYAALDWGQLMAEDPTNAQAHWFQYQQLKDRFDTASGDLSKKEQARLQEQQQSTARAMEEAERVLARDIPGWGPDLIKQLATAASTYGFSTAELGQTSDPRSWQVLNDARQWREHQAKQKTAQTIQKQAAVKPAVTTKGGSFKGAGVHDNLPAEEWARRRNAELARKRTG